MVQTPAIMSFLGYLLNYTPSDPLMAYEVRQVYLSVVDVFNSFANWSFVIKNADEKEAKKKEYFNTYLPFMFGKFEERLKKQANRMVMVGQCLTYADFGFAGFAKATFLAKADEASYEVVYKNTPLLKAYLENINRIC